MADKRHFCRAAFVALACLFVAFGALWLCGCTTNTDAPGLKSSSVSNSAVKEAGTLKVGVNTSLSPMAGTGNSKIIGIDVDIAAAMADQMGLKLEVVDTGSNAAKALANGDVDVVLGVDVTEGPANAKLTDQYLQTCVSYFAKAGSNEGTPKAGANKKIAVQGSSKSSWSATNLFGKDAVLSCDDLTSAFQSLQKGDVQYVAADAVVGLYAANKANIDVEIVGVEENSGGYCAAVKSDSTETYSAVQDALTKIKSAGMIDVIENKWLGQELNLDNVAKIEKSSSSGSGSSDSTDNKTDSSANSSDSSSSSSSSDSSSSSSSTDSGAGSISGNGSDSTASATDAADVANSSSSSSSSGSGY